MKHPRLGVPRRARSLALGLTMLGAGALAPLAQAAVVNVDFSSNAFSAVPYNFSGFYLNVVTGATSAFSLNGFDINPYFAPNAFYLFMPASGGVVGSSGAATRLAPGDTIGAASSYIGGSARATFAESGSGYFGFRFLNESTGATNYGYLWVSETLPITGTGDVRVLAYAYEDTGAAITISAVPEPGTAWLWAGGLVAVLGAGRRRRA